MKIRLLTMILALIAQAAIAQQTQGPLSKNQVTALVKAGMEAVELTKLIHEHGIDFDLTEDFLQALSKLGARESVIQALRAARPQPLSQEQVMQLVAGHVPSDRAMTLVKQHGINFFPDDEYLQTLRLAGGDDRLIAALREVGKAAKTAGLVRENLKDGLKYAWLPPGTFLMGCSPGDVYCSDAEKPPHSVTITKGLWLGQTEVTVGAYKRFSGSTGRPMPTEPDLGDRLLNAGWRDEAMPMVEVTWEDAAAFCTWAGGRLPTEAEWEYAARAGSTASNYGPIDEVAWQADNSGSKNVESVSIWKQGQDNYMKWLYANGNGIHEVGQKRANAFGLFDTLGNVWEWVNDWFDENYYLNSPAQDPSGPASGQLHVRRGGSWAVIPLVVRVSDRTGVGSGSRFNLGGFRCGRETFAP